MRHCLRFGLAAILMLVALGLFQLVGTGLAGSAAFLRVQAGTQAPAVGSGYHLLKKIPLGGEGGWDYLALDAAARRLYIARATRVMVLDADAGTAVGEIPDTPGVHGVALAPEFGRGFTSNGRGASVTIFDLKTLKPLGQTKTGTNPDAILYDPATRRVFTFNGGSNDATSINAATGEVAGTVPLGGRPEFAAASGSGQVYVNLEDKSELLAIDSQKLSVTHRWPLKPCEEPSGLAIDSRHQRLFVGCHNQMMAVVDAATGRIVTTLPIGRGVDANTFDPGTQLAFSSNGDGTLTVVHEETPDKFSVVENVTTQRGARTMALDAQTHNIFLVTAEFAPPPAPTPENPRPRPPIVPGSFVLLIFGR
jgi:DNA-binding beta-propeller fold protein YncE